jgi:hypothetical protein
VVISSQLVDTELNVREKEIDYGFCCKKSGYFTKTMEISQVGYLYTINRSIMIQKAIIIT